MCVTHWLCLAQLVHNLRLFFCENIIIYWDWRRAAIGAIFVHLRCGGKLPMYFMIKDKES